jgi:hypothetical protein
MVSYTKERTQTEGFQNRVLRRITKREEGVGG